MFVKSLLVGLVTAAMAGGVVYYGTAPQGQKPSFDGAKTALEKVAKPFNPSAEKTDETVNVQTLVTSDDPDNVVPEDVAEEVPVAEFAEMPRPDSTKTDTAEEVETAPEPGQKKWLDQYLKQKVKAKDSAPEIGEEKPYNDVREKSWPDDKEAETPKAVFDVEDETFEPIEKMKPADVEEDTETTQTRTVTTVTIIEDMMISDDNVSETIARVREEISKIEAQELREQAYFSLVDYALRNKKYAVAENTIENIDTVAMKETARINLAVTLAKNGAADAAFDIIDAIEAEEYRDILRLQVIEAMIAPVETADAGN